MEVVITSLDALIHRATDATLDRPDPAAVEAFCSVLSESPNGAYEATRILAARMRSAHPAEALLALQVLDCCMKRCDPSFRAEVDKFRFLNEMIKLVSPKYYGSKTAPAVRQKVLNLMHTWTLEFPREVKIRDAYEMLKKQGVVKDVPPPAAPPPQEDVPPPVPRPRNKDVIFEDEERSRMLQKLLQSKNPDDLQAANRLIKTMVREDERRVEAISRRVTELQTVHNNARLLDEMLEQYRPGVSSVEDLQLIRELHAACNRLRPTLFKLAAETQQNEQMLNLAKGMSGTNNLPKFWFLARQFGDVLEASDELGQVFEKYTAIILHGKSLESVNNAPRSNFQPGSILLNGDGNSLLDLATPLPNPRQNLPEISSGSGQTNIKELDDIFSNVHLAKIEPEISNAPILKPVSVTSLIQDLPETSVKSTSQPIINKGLADLDALGADLLKDSLPPSHRKGGQFNSKQLDRVPMNSLSKMPQRAIDEISREVDHKSPADKKRTGQNSMLDLDFLISKTLDAEGKNNVALSNNDDLMVDISWDDSLLGAKHKTHDEDGEISLLEYLNEIKASKTSQLQRKHVPPSLETNGNETAQAEPESPKISKDENIPNKLETKQSPTKAIEMKPLTDINISLDCITPGGIPPLTAFEEENGITVVLHFTKNKPRDDVSVIVISTTSRNTHPIRDYKFHAVVPKGCKVRLLPPSGENFPACSPFLPPAAVTQVMLLARPDSSPVFLKFVITYSCQDDSISEIGEVSSLPLDQL